jgi:hypothetical protein
LAALYLAAAPVAFQGVLACAVRDACLLAALRAAAQKVDWRANSLFLPGLQAAACTVFLDRPAAWAALAGRDADHPYAVRFRVLFQEPVRDCPLAADEKELLVVPL